MSEIAALPFKEPPTRAEMAADRMLGIATHCASALLPPPDPEMPCCMPSAVYGDRCECWDTILDVEPTTDVQEGPNALRVTRCADCAYRRDSPERTELDGDQLPHGPQQRFYCHQGMSKAVGLVHPSGATMDMPGDSYEPVSVRGRSWQADGRPALLCAGWAGLNGLKP